MAGKTQTHEFPRLIRGNEKPSSVAVMLLLSQVIRSTEDCAPRMASGRFTGVGTLIVKSVSVSTVSNTGLALGSIGLGSNRYSPIFEEFLGELVGAKICRDEYSRGTAPLLLEAKR